MEQAEIINKFVKDSIFFLVKYDTNGDFGKIIKNEEIEKVNLAKNEIHRSIEYKNGNYLFTFDLKPEENERILDNSLQLLLKNLKQAKDIELVYPDIFTWIFNGTNIKAYAIIPVGTENINSTLGRYGGTQTFIKVLRHHLRNMCKISIGKTPDYSYLKPDEKVEETELSVGSLNKTNGLYSILISLTDTYIDILNKSEKNIQKPLELKNLDIKFWAREINPDMINEAKHIKIKNPLSLEEAYPLYHRSIKNIMSLEYKGNYNRFLLSRYLLSIHNPKDAKFIFDSVLSPKEREHIKQGNCSTQWGYILNNIKRYGCPTKSELKSFWPKEDKSTHPLELVQDYLDKKDIGEENDGKENWKPRIGESAIEEAE